MPRYAPIDPDAPDVLTVDGLLSAEECARVIADAERRGFEAATIAYRDGARLNPEVRNNTRVDLEDAALERLLFERAGPALPTLHGERAVGLNPRLRVYRYGPGERFATHRDGWVELDGRRSRLTLMVYLSAVEEGGETTFTRLARRVAPAPGRAVLFQHSLLHASEPVVRGTKYVLRTDVLFG